MSKKMKVLVSVLVAVLMLVGSGSAIAMAQEEEEPEPTVEANGLLTRVAEILGIPEEDLIDAFGQARQEMTEEVFLNALDKAVEEGLITQEEADEIREWWLQKPDVMDRGLFGSASRFMGLRAQIGSGLCQDGQQPLQQMRQRAFRGARGAWQQMGSPWLAE